MNTALSVKLVIQNIKAGDFVPNVQTKNELKQKEEKNNITTLH